MNHTPVSNGPVEIVIIGGGIAGLSAAYYATKKLPGAQIILIESSDRWGGKIFEKEGYDNENVFWDGTNEKGTIVPSGTYFYSIEVQTNGAVVKQTGFLELIQ